MAKTPKQTDEELSVMRTGHYVRIICPTGHRRRAGLSFSPEGTIVDVAALSEADQRAIVEDPHLTIKPVEMTEVEQLADGTEHSASLGEISESQR